MNIDPSLGTRNISHNTHAINRGVFQCSSILDPCKTMIVMDGQLTMTLD